MQSEQAVASYDGGVRGVGLLRARMAREGRGVGLLRTGRGIGLLRQRVTNCIGTPADRVNIGATWEYGAVRISSAVIYRGAISNKAFKDDPAGCLSTYADGTDAPGGCRVGSFTTVDLTMRWKATSQLEVFGSILNLFDKVPPLDVATYGAVSYNPLDYSGAVGRFFSLGLKYKF